MGNIKLDFNKGNFEKACDEAGGDFGENKEGELYYYCKLGEKKIKSNGRAVWIGEQLEPVYAQMSAKSNTRVSGYADESKGTREFRVKNPDRLDYSQISLTTEY